MFVSNFKFHSYPLSSELAVLLNPVWTFLTVTDTPVRSDVIFVFGSQDILVPGHAAALYRTGYAPTVLVTGQYGRMTRNVFEKPEALVFKDVLVRSGVPSQAIVVETTAQNTLENVTKGLSLLRQTGVSCQISFTCSETIRHAQMRGDVRSSGTGCSRILLLVHG